MCDADYFARRLREERAAAQSAADPQVAAIHADMALLYEAASKALRDSRPPLPPGEDEPALA